MLFKLYGTALCQTVLNELGGDAMSVPALVRSIAGKDLDNREKHNLERRVRRALESLEGEGLVRKDWIIEPRPLQVFKLTTHAQRTANA